MKTSTVSIISLLIYGFTSLICLKSSSLSYENKIEEFEQELPLVLTSDTAIALFRQYSLVQSTSSLESRTCSLSTILKEELLFHGIAPYIRYTTIHQHRYIISLLPCFHNEHILDTADHEVEACYSADLPFAPTVEEYIICLESELFLLQKRKRIEELIPHKSFIVEEHYIKVDREISPTPHSGTGLMIQNMLLATSCIIQLMIFSLLKKMLPQRV